MKVSFPVRIYIVALVLRLIPVLLTRGLGIGLDDMFQYDMLARSLASGNGFRWYAQEDLKLLDPYVEFDLSTANDYDPERGVYTSFRAPLYPTFLALVYFLNGLDFSRFFAARLAQVILLGAPLAPLTYLVSRRFLPDAEKTARISAWIAACYPMLLVYPLGLGTENLFFVLLLSSFLFLLKSFEKPSAFRLLLSGFVLALAALTRSVLLPFAFLAFLVLFLLHRRRAILFIAMFFAVISPWIIRNSLLHQKITGIETSMGYNLYLGYHPEGNGSFIFGPSLDLLTILDDAGRDKVGTQKALEFIKDQPGRFLPLAVNRLGFFFGLEKRVLMYFYSNNVMGFIPKPALLTVSAILLLPFVFISTSAAFGLSLLQRNPKTTLLMLLFISYILPHVLILSEDRFHLALIPYFAILAAHGWTNGIKGLSAHWRESSFGKLALMFAGFAILLLLTNWGLELFRDADKIAQLLAPNGNQTYFPY
jgi:4-amino-4-deoxy-L-arabinose transferase-like glycosyltransferase